MISRQAAARAADSAGVIDAVICHGAAGVGHLFNGLHQASGEYELGEAARRWFDEVLLLRRPGKRLAGFSTLAAREAGTTRRVAYRGVLNGAAGVGLVLITASTSLTPSWDRWLLASIPPHS